MKLNAEDSAWLFNGDTDVTISEADLAERLKLGHIVEPIRDGEDLIITLPDATCVILKFQGEDVQDGETTAWNYGDEDGEGFSGDYYLKVDKG